MSSERLQLLGRMEHKRVVVVVVVMVGLVVILGSAVGYWSKMGCWPSVWPGWSCTALTSQTASHPGSGQSSGGVRTLLRRDLLHGDHRSLHHDDRHDHTHLHGGHHGRSHLRGVLCTLHDIIN